jgi:hypothetical protein
MMSAPLNAAIVPRVPAQERATYLSFQSLTGRLGFGIYLILMAAIAGGTGADDWPAIRLLLLIGFGIAAGGLLALGYFSRRLDPEPQQ